MRRFPLYGEMKLALIIYLWYPRTKVKTIWKGLSMGLLFFVFAFLRGKGILHRFTTIFTMVVTDIFKLKLCTMKGTGYVYETLLRPYVAKHETDIDHKLLEWRARMWDLAIFYWQNCSELGQSAFFQVMQYFAAGRFNPTNNEVGFISFHLFSLAFQISCPSPQEFHPRNQTRVHGLE